MATDGLLFKPTRRLFQLNPDMAIGGVERRAYRTAKFGSWERSLALDAESADVGRRAGLVFKHDLMRRTPNNVASHALVALAHETGSATMQDRVVKTLFAAYFTRGADVGNHAVLADVAADCVLDRPHVSAALVEPARIDAIVREDQQLRSRGFRGVPSFVFAGYFLFSKAQLTEVIVRTLRDASAEIRPTPR